MYSVNCVVSLADQRSLPVFLFTFVNTYAGGFLVLLQYHKIEIQG